MFSGLAKNECRLHNPCVINLCHCFNDEGNCWTLPNTVPIKTSKAVWCSDKKSPWSNKQAVRSWLISLCCTLHQLLNKRQRSNCNKPRNASEHLVWNRDAIHSLHKIRVIAPSRSSPQNVSRNLHLALEQTLVISYWFRVLCLDTRMIQPNLTNEQSNFPNYSSFNVNIQHAVKNHGMIAPLFHPG